MKILILVAGNSVPSNACTLAEAARDTALSSGFCVEEICLSDLTIDQFSLHHYEEGYEYEEDFLGVQKSLMESDGFIIASPIWNFSVPAHLKNLIDRMGSFALDGDTRSRGQLDGKPFFLIFTGGAPLPAWKGLMQKTTSHIVESLQYFGASHIGTHFEPKCTVGRGKFGLVVDRRPVSLETIKKKTSDFLRVVESFERTGKAPAKNRARLRVMRIGEVIMKKFF